jgi:hypothetical protein
MPAQSWEDASSLLADILVATAAPLAPLWTAATPFPRSRGAVDGTEKPEAGWATTMRQMMAQTAMDALHTRPRPCEDLAIVTFFRVPKTGIRREWDAERKLGHDCARLSPDY